MNIALLDPKVKTQTPSYATDGSGGLDIVATSVKRVERSYSKKKDRHVGGYTEYGTNLVVEIPTGFVGILLPKSSSRDYTQRLANSIGLIDSDYRGELKFSYKSDDENQRHYRSVYEKGDVIGQLLIVPFAQVPITLVDFDALSKTERADGGHGSTEVLKPLPSTADTGGGEVQPPAAPQPDSTEVKRQVQDQVDSAQAAQTPVVPTLPDVVNTTARTEGTNLAVADQLAQAELDQVQDVAADHSEPKDYDALAKPDGSITDDSNENMGPATEDLVPKPFEKGMVGKLVSLSATVAVLSDEHGVQFTHEDTEEKLKTLEAGISYVLKRGHLVVAPKDAAA